MGVKDLWNIVSPLSERKPLFELQGKIIAIDLSCWIVDSQSITENIAQPKLHLRNLFFRTSYFLLHDIFPIFVLEGTAPILKHKTIAKRNEIRHVGKENKTSKKGGRSRFNHILKECEEMLNYMGLFCIKGYGEAEAMCAYLNEDGLVDGCISQDSDCFLYGAKTVYRNFCTSTQGNRITSGGSIDEYSMEKIEQVFKLGRNKMIALALLCGCDYDDGLSGIGKEAALKLFKTIEDNEILDRMKQWKTDSKFTRMEIELSNPNICANCGHSGKIRSHIRIGCIECGTLVRCKDTYKEKRILISNELAVRKKALLVENFPNQDLINEFLIRKGPVPSKLDLEWRKPKIVEFINFMERKVLWEPNYGFAKIFPLMTRWQLTNLIKLPIEQRLTLPGLFIPEKIIKVRKIRSIDSYEILWLDKDKLLKQLNLTPDNLDNKNNEEESLNTLLELVTVEPQDAVLKCYPNIVDIFHIIKKKKKEREPCNKKKIKDNIHKSAEKKNTEIKKKGKRKILEVEKNKKIIEFLTFENREFSLEESFRKFDITPKRNKKTEYFNTPNIMMRGKQFDRVMNVEHLDSILNGSLEAMFNQLTPEDFSNDIDNSINMSIIINNICNIKSNQQNTTEVQDVNYLKNDNYIDYKCDIKKKNDIVLEHKISYLKDLQKTEEIDELTNNEIYIPLDVRLDIKTKQSKNNTSSSLKNENYKDRFSLGIESFLNGTD